MRLISECQHYGHFTQITFLVHWQAYSVWDTLQDFDPLEFYFRLITFIAQMKQNDT